MGPDNYVLTQDQLSMMFGSSFNLDCRIMQLALSWFFT